MFRTSVELTRKTGDLTAWKRGNRFFLNELRKQFLLWKALRDEDREYYTIRGIDLPIP
jgi:hypothetical protein